MVLLRWKRRACLVCASAALLQNEERVLHAAEMRSKVCAISNKGAFYAHVV